jgi:DnaK suppressor protein
MTAMNVPWFNLQMYLAKSRRTTVTTTEMKGFRKILLARQAEIANTRRGREAIAVEVTPDELDRIQHATERELAIGHLERESRRLREVRDALCGIDAGTFGICRECGQEIKLKRLAAVPWTSSCIICQAAADRDSHQSWNEIDKPLADAA